MGIWMSKGEQEVLQALRDAQVPDPQRFRSHLKRLFAQCYRTPGDFKRARSERLVKLGLPYAMVDAVVSCQEETSPGMGDGGPRGSFDGPESVQSFWRCVDSAQEANGFLQLPDGTCWLGSSALGSVLLVRPVYDRIWTIICDMDVGSVIGVLGTPGIGKTVLGAYILRQCKVKHQQVVYHSVKKAMLFGWDKTGKPHVWQAASVSSFAPVIMDPASMYIVDGREPDMLEQDGGARLILLSLPDRMVYKKTLVPPALTLYMDIWTTEEMQKLKDKCYSYLSNDEFEQLLLWFGPIPRWVLEQTSPLAMKGVKLALREHERAARSREGAAGSREGAAGSREGAAGSHEGEAGSYEGAAASREGAAGSGDGAAEAREGAAGAREGSGEAREAAEAHEEGVRASARVWFLRRWHLETALAREDLVAVLKAINSDQAMKASHLLVHMRASEDLLTSYYTCASEWVAQQVVERAADQGMVKTFSMMMAMGETTGWEHVFGELFQQYALCFLVDSDRSYPCRELPKGKESMIKLSPAEVVRFEKLDSDTLQAPNTLYAQKSDVREKLAAADAILTPSGPDKPAYLIQVTTGSRKKPLSNAGVTAVQEALRAMYERKAVTDILWQKKDTMPIVLYLVPAKGWKKFSADPTHVAESPLKQLVAAFPVTLEDVKNLLEKRNKRKNKQELTL